MSIVHVSHSATADDPHLWESSAVWGGHGGSQRIGVAERQGSREMGILETANAAQVVEVLVEVVVWVLGPLAADLIIQEDQVEGLQLAGRGCESTEEVTVERLQPIPRLHLDLDSTNSLESGAADESAELGHVCRLDVVTGGEIEL